MYVRSYVQSTENYTPLVRSMELFKNLQMDSSYKADICSVSLYICYAFASIKNGYLSIANMLRPVFCFIFGSEMVLVNGLCMQSYIVEIHSFGG